MTFKQFGIKHLSHSHLDLFRQDQGMWAMRYIHKIKDHVGAAAHRGNAVEKGCQLYHSGSEFDDPVEEAISEYNKRTALGYTKEEIEKEAGNISAMVKQYQLHFDNKFPKLEAYQKRIEVEIPNIDIPLIGFTDFEFEDCIVDLKTTTRLPSAISASHRRQGAIYSKASGNRSVDFIYITPKKSARYRLENADEAWNEVCAIAHRLQNFLSAFDNKEDLTNAVVPNFDSFYWNNPKTRQRGKELFGF